MRRALLSALWLCVCARLAGQPIASLPPRATSATAGRAFVQRIATSGLEEREREIQAEIFAGNVPDFLRRFCPVTVTRLIGGRTNTATFFVAPDYLAVGTDEDYFLTPLAPMTAQRVADRLGCILPTRQMVNDIYASAAVKLAPAPMTPGPEMTTVPSFQLHSDLVHGQREQQRAAHPLGSLVAGHKKDLVLTPRLAGAPGKVAIYGWHQTNGTPIQPLYLGHTAAWVDYSQGVRLVQQAMTVNGQPKTVAEVLADPALASLLCDEGVMAQPRYPTNGSPAPSQAGFKPGGHFGEQITSYLHAPGVTVQINAPARAAFTPERPVLLILYALPNGNTTEQTIGRKLRPGDDWHFDIQHIGAQTRFLRELLTNRTVVVAYLEADTKSWPAWRQQHGDAVIPEIVARVKKFFPTNRVEVVLTGHSGGGSFTFGYLNAVATIPDDVTRIAFLDSNYGYDPARGHTDKLARWLEASDRHSLRVLAYDDAAALLDGKSFVSAAGGTWGRSHAMLRDLGARFSFTSRTNGGLETSVAQAGRIQFLLKENPDRKILHTVQVERNGFIHALVTGTPQEGQGYEYFGERAYTRWVDAD